MWEQDTGLQQQLLVPQAWCLRLFLAAHNCEMRVGTHAHKDLGKPHVSIVGQKLDRGPIQESAKQEKALPKQQEP